MLQLRESAFTETQPWEEASEEFDWDIEDSSSSDNQPYLPSPWEIERLCREIRQGWSEAEHRKRAGHCTIPLEIAAVPCKILLSDGIHLDPH